MKTGEKKGIIILIIIAIAIIVLIFMAIRSKEKTNTNVEQTTQVVEEKVAGEITKTEEDGTVVNTSTKLKENKEIEGLIVSYIKFTEKNGTTLLTADVTNKTGMAQNGFLVDIVLYDVNGKETARIPASIVSMQEGETIELRAEITENYVGAYDLKLEKK